MRRPALIVISLLFLLRIGASAQFGLTCYVSPQGNDNNSGEQAFPWRTIRKAFNSATAGSTIYILAGVYNEKDTLNVSGDSAHGPITFRAFANDAVIVDGTGKPGDQIFLIENRSYIRIIGLELRNNLNQTFGTGIWVKGSGNRIEIRNNHIHDMRAANGGGDAMAISVYGTGATPLRNIVIDSNLIRDCEPGHSESLTLNGNVDTFLVTNNVVHNVDNIGIDMIGGEGTSPLPSADVARNGVCRGNTVYNARSNYGGGYAAGIYVDGGINIIVERNRVYQCDVGIEIGCENHGRTASGMIVRDNLLYNNDKRGLSFGGYNYPTTGKVADSQFLNNTCFQNDILNTGAGELVIEYAVNCFVRNNIFSATSQNRLLTTAFGNNFNVINYNLWFAPGSANSATVDYNGTVYPAFAGYQSGSSQDANSQFGDPLFLSATLPSPDLHIGTSSPAINAGDPGFVTAINEADFDGNPRVVGIRVDPGAYEFLLDLPAPPALIAPGDDSIIPSMSVVLRWAHSGDTYRVQLSTDSSFSQQVIDESGLSDTTYFAGSLVNNTKYFWRIRARNADGDGGWSAIWRFTYSNTTRWTIVSVSRIVADANKNTLFPGAISEAFAYDPGSGYVASESLLAGRGYWLKFSSDDTAYIAGDSITAETIDIVEGWNLIGSISSPVSVSSVTSIPPAIGTSNFFGYDRGYATADSIRPGRGYWVKCSQSGQLVLGPAGMAASRIRIVPSAEVPPAPPLSTNIEQRNIAGEFTLGQNYPNPFNPATRLSYVIGHSSFVSLGVFDVGGREVARLVDERQEPGNYNVEWNAGNISSGVYFWRMTSGGFSVARKMLLVR